MKGIRRAAAVCLTMTVAVSTLFGNTAWADMPQKTEKKKCVHVHTEECYGEPDEEATSSQIGEEPTECTHVCTVESGCIRNIAASSGTNEDDSENGPDDEETNDQKDSADKAEDDEKQEDAPSVSTPSDMEDTTVPGGTVIPAVKSQIFSWSWYDPEENLLDGKLELNGVTEESQPSFEEVTEYLPQAIIAQVGEESEAGKEEKLPITGWSCNEYVQDEEGCWPLEGTYEFAAELPEAYELAEDVDALVVEVSVTGDQAAMPVYDYKNVVLNVNFEEGKTCKGLAYDESGFSSLNNDVMNLLNDRGIEVTNSGENSFQLRMTNATTIQNLELSRGTWEIVLNGSNVLEGKGKGVGGVGLKIKENVSATIKAGKAPASLTAKNSPTKGTSNDGSSGIAVAGNLTIESGTTIEATADAGTNSAPDSGAIVVGSKGTLNINGGSVTAAGTGKNGVHVRGGGEFRMSGGSLTVTGSGKPVIENVGNFNLSGGTISTKSNSDGIGFLQSGGSATIQANELITDRLCITGNSSFTVARGGKVTSGSTIIKSGSTLTNEGEFVSNGAFEKEEDGTFINKGTISGTGSLPDDAKQIPDNITVYTAEISADYRDNMSINV